MIIDQFDDLPVILRKSGEAGAQGLGFVGLLGDNLRRVGGVHELRLDVGFEARFLTASHA